VVTIISRFRVRNGLEEEVRAAFLNRPRLVENAPGFCGIEVLTDAADPSVFLLITRWSGEETFRAWHGGEAHRQSHALIPRGLKLDSSFTSVTIANRVEDPAGILTLSDALAEATGALSRWLLESDAVFALLLAPDGAIRERNPAGDRLFPADPAKGPGAGVWDYLACSDVPRLRALLADPASLHADGLFLNLDDGQSDPITLVASAFRSRNAVLLIGTEERRHDRTFRTEILKLTNDLSVMMRESARQNRELVQANRKIELLARTDALTGLGSRRALDEALQRETARAQRRTEPLSLIMADLDHFKSINDRFGHGAGDQALVRAAAVLLAGLRPYDLAARYGGEEFVLLLPAETTEGALAVAERVRRQIAEIELPECPGGLTVSLGVATWAAGESPEEFVARADAALYVAKRSGRNRVEAASEVPV
jgi:diguanylate cyclase (GGDEF)-like protein